MNKKVLALLLVLAGCQAAGGLRGSPPPAAIEAVADVYHGVTVVDPYRWMEAQPARFEQWLAAQDAHARAWLAEVPGRAGLRERVLAWSGGGETLTRVRLANGLVFAQRRVAAAERDELVVAPLAGEGLRVLHTPAAGTALDFFLPAPDGAHVLLATSPAGSQASVLSILRVADGAFLAERIERAEEARPSWRDAGSFYYTQLADVPADAEEVERYRNSRVRLHELGQDPGGDPVVLGAGVAQSLALEPEDIAFLRTSPGSRHAVALVARGDEPDFAVYLTELASLVSPAVAWRAVAGFSDGVSDVALAGDSLFLMTRAGAPRYQVLVVAAGAPELAHARVAVPPSERVLVSLAADAEALYVSSLAGGLGHVQRYELATGTLSELELPLAGTLRRPLTDPGARGVLVGLQDWITPLRWFHLDAGRWKPLALTAPWTIDTRAFLVEEVEARSADGTLVPLSIVRRRDLARDGKHPAWLVAYGAYGIPLLSDHLGGALAHVEAGGVYAVAHVRGGGEHGSAWHEGGKGANKHRAVEDLVACAGELYARGLASPATLAIAGASGGGVTVGLALVEHPEFFRAALLDVPDCNPLRLEVTADGPFLAEEWGSTESEAGFRALFAMDPTQHVHPGRPYPAVLFTAGHRDPRVPPWQPAKLAAHLQASGSARGPVLLRVDYEGGHGAGSGAQVVDALTDQIVFLHALCRP
ncbi:MAG: prolyl oligopeptidase family serine peptidase [Planctomycetota bacterium]